MGLSFGPPSLQVFEKGSCGYIKSFGGAGSGPGQLVKPFGLAVDSKYLYVADNGNTRIQVGGREYQGLYDDGDKEMEVL